MGLRQRLLFSCGLLLALPLLIGKLHGAGPVLIAYGGFNETMAPLWVGVERGLFRKYGADAQVLQTRSGQIMMATLATGGASLVWAAPSSALSSTAAGMKLGCFAAGNNRLSRELIVRKGIESTEDLRGKIVRRAEHRRRRLVIDHGGARCPRPGSRQVQTQHACHRRHRHADSGAP